MSINLEPEASPLGLFDKTFWPMADATEVFPIKENSKSDDDDFDASISDLELLRFLEDSNLFENSNSVQSHTTNDCNATTKKVATQKFPPLTKQGIFECDEHITNSFVFAEALPVEPEPIAAKVSNAPSVDGENQCLPVATFLHSSEELSLLNLEVQSQVTRKSTAVETRNGDGHVAKVISEVSSNDAPVIVMETSHERHSTTTSSNSSNSSNNKKEWKTTSKASAKQPMKIGRNAKKKAFTETFRVCEKTGGYEILVRRQGTLQPVLQFLPLGSHDVVKGQSPLLRPVSGNKHLRDEVERRYENEYLPEDVSKKMKTGLYEGIRDDFIHKGGRFWKQKKGETWWTEIKVVKENMRELREIVATKFKDENKKKQREQEKQSCSNSDETTSPLRTPKNQLEQKAEKKPGGRDAH